jgi:Spy/CpxP family protein refolding chaperone
VLIVLRDSRLNESQRIVEELIDLLEDETSKDEEIRKKIQALQEARAEALREYANAQEELATVLTTPRQEAVFLIKGAIK